MNNHSNNRLDNTIVSIENLSVHFPIKRGFFGKTTGYVKAVDDISFSIRRGAIFALVGESGCGKTTTAQAIAGLVPTTTGTIRLSQHSQPLQVLDWKTLSGVEKKSVRQSMQFIFQDPYSSLNPRMSVHSILEEPLIIHNKGNHAERDTQIRNLIKQTGLSDAYLNRYPHEFSGGQRQRIGIARALTTNPELVIADEPVSALDVSIQAQIINLLQELRSTFNQSMLFISHDLAVVRHIADMVAVMYMGRIVEYGSESDLFLHPHHPYTHLLLESIPVPGKGRKRRGKIDAEDNARQQPDCGCSFYPRCPKRLDECLSTRPELAESELGHGVACFNCF